jgi:serine/threonine-protein kinase RsbW
MGFAKRKRDDENRGPCARAAKSGGAAGNAAASASVKSKVNGTLRYEFPSDFDAGCAVQTEILQEVERHGFNHNSLFATRLALEEALVNAIKHGNKLDPKKIVIVEARVSRDRVEIEIEDQGPGFDRSSVPDPTAEENLCKCSGRGILLIEAYMNKVSWSRDGRRVHLLRLNEASELPDK